MLKLFLFLLKRLAIFALNGLEKIEALRSLLKPRASICLKRAEELYSGQLDLGIFFEVFGNGWDHSQRNLVSKNAKGFSKGFVIFGLTGFFHYINVVY